MSCLELPLKSDSLFCFVDMCIYKPYIKFGDPKCSVKFLDLQCNYINFNRHYASQYATSHD